MQKLRVNHALFKTKTGRCWILAERITDTAEALKSAVKPRDLEFPITRLNDLNNQIRDLMWEWVAEKIGLDKRDRARWPHV